jgi:hypothetical protein
LVPALAAGVSVGGGERAIPDASGALATARSAFVGRWKRQIGKYVEKRIQDVASQQYADRALALRPLIESGEFARAMELLGGKYDEGPQKQLRKGLVATICLYGADADEVCRLLPSTAANFRFANKNQTSLMLFLATKPARTAVEKLCKAAAPLLEGIGYAADGDLEVVEPEFVFGAMPHVDKPKPPLQLRLGRGRVEVYGRIDSVVRRHGSGNFKGTRYRIVDFKTGKSKSVIAAAVATLLQPQLMLYALALDAIGPVGTGHPKPAEVEDVGYDGVRTAKLPHAAVTPEITERAREVFGAVLDSARDGFYPMLPHPQGCPLMAYAGAYCDFEDICRMRPAFGPDEKTEEEDGEEAQS